MNNLYRLRSRAGMVLAAVGFTLAMLFGGGAPHDFIIGNGGGQATPTTTP